MTSWRGFQTTNFRLAVRVGLAEHSEYHQVAGLYQHGDHDSDCILAMYHQLLQNKDTYCLSARFGKKYIGFAVMSQMDKNAMAMVTFRTSETAQRLGLDAMFKSILVKMLKSNIPGVDRLVYPSQLVDKMTVQPTIITKQIVLDMQLTSDDLNSVTTRLSAAVLGDVSTDALSGVGAHELKYLDHDAIRKVVKEAGGELFPAGLVFIGCANQPRAVSDINIRHYHASHVCYGYYKNNRLSGLCTTSSMLSGHLLLTSVHLYGQWPEVIMTSALQRSFQLVIQQSGSSKLPHRIQIVTTEDAVCSKLLKNAGVHIISEINWACLEEKL